MQEIIIATKNKGKVADFKEIFSPYGITVKSLLDLKQSLPDIEETGTSFAENAALKAEGIAELLQQAVLADDSGLVVDALDGAPGIYSARYAGEPTDDVKNYKKVLEALKNEDNKAARFVCTLALALPGKTTVFQTGYCQGEIADAPKGENGFGYDPIFIPEGFDRTMAELSKEDKNIISHRYHALMKMKRWLDENQK